MKSRAAILALGALAVGWATISGNLAAAFAGFFGAGALLMLHVIEIKLNRLLDERGIVVRDSELS